MTSKNEPVIHTMNGAIATDGASKKGTQKPYHNLISLEIDYVIG